MYLHSIALEAQARFVQQFWGKREVALRGREVDMAEISGKLRQQTLYIGAATIPGNQSMRYARMPQVMQPGLITGAVLTFNAGNNPQPPKSASNGGFAQHATVLEAEQWCIQVVCVGKIALLHVLAHCGIQVLTQWHQPRLIELARPDAQHRLIKVDILHRQVTCLTRAKTCSI